MSRRATPDDKLIRSIRIIRTIHMPREQAFCEYCEYCEWNSTTAIAHLGDFPLVPRPIGLPLHCLILLPQILAQAPRGLSDCPPPLKPGHVLRSALDYKAGRGFLEFWLMASHPPHTCRDGGQRNNVTVPSNVTWPEQKGAKGHRAGFVGTPFLGVFLMLDFCPWTNAKSSRRWLCSWAQNRACGTAIWGKWSG